jgi:hypothetical protein
MAMNKLPRRRFLKVSGAAGAGLAAWPILGAGAESKPALPNFVVYISDDHGRPYSEPYGNTDVN